MRPYSCLALSPIYIVFGGMAQAETRLIQLFLPENVDMFVSESF